MDSLISYQAEENLLENRTILVTGAGQGIGAAAAMTYAKYGATVILHGRKVEKLERVYDEIEALGRASAIILPFDFENATDDGIVALAEAVTSQVGQLDGILHNAAWTYGAMPLECHSLKQWQTIMQVNLLVPVALTQACLPLLKASPDASVIMTGDTHGQKPAAYWGAYGVAKSAIEGLIKIQSEEWEIFPGLRINALIPGAVYSPQQTKTHPGGNNRLLRHPLDLMKIYLYLMGPDSRKIRGKTFYCQEEVGC